MELLIVMAIIGILVALLLPALSSVREASRKTKCANNLKQLALALQSYESAHGNFPPGGDTTSELAWTVYILPQIGQQNLFDQFSFGSGSYYDIPGRLTPALTAVPTLLCPSASEQRSNLSRQGTALCTTCGNERVPHDTSYPWDDTGEDVYTTHYVGIMGPVGNNAATGEDYAFDNIGTHGGFSTAGVLYHDSAVRTAHIRDGMSNTYAIGEVSWDGYRKYRAWHRGASTPSGSVKSAMGAAKNLTDPINANLDYLNGQDFNDGSFGSNHIGGAQFARCDGSVHFVSQNVDFDVYLATASRDGNEEEVLAP
ncbi:MAG: DUF1559 domain-containing protein [Pirellulales bacterium]|nr:DUF1559 domain-containing protein [Pirellulales bacterium]